MTMTPASKEYFDQNAEKWDGLQASYYTEALRTTAIRKAYLRPEYIVADIGAGTGFMTAGLAPLVHQVCALDGSMAMLDIARKNLDAFSNVIYREADGLKLPLSDESMDAVFANMYLHHCPDPMAAILEMSRLLRPGGRLVITDMYSHPYAWLREEMADTWQGFEHDQMRSWLRQAGLVNVIVRAQVRTAMRESILLRIMTRNSRRLASVLSWRLERADFQELVRQSRLVMEQRQRVKRDVVRAR